MQFLDPHPKRQKTLMLLRGYCSFFFVTDVSGWVLKQTPYSITVKSRHQV